MSIVERIQEIRSRDDFSANDITVAVIDGFAEFYDINPSKVKTEVYIRQDDVRGRADVVVQDGIGIETKSNLEHEHDKALEQVYNILTKLEDEGHNTPVGIATDGVDWEFYLLVKDSPHQYYSFSIDEGTTDEDLEEELWKALTPLRQETFRPDPTAEKVAEVFRPNGPAYNEITTQIRVGMEHTYQTDRVEFTSKFIPWFEVFSQVYNDFQGKCQNLAQYGEFNSEFINELQTHEELADAEESTIKGAVELYTRHTYLALLAKSLSALVTLGDDTVLESQLSNPESILTGKAVRETGVEISDPNDYFTWVKCAENPDRILNSILQVLRRFSANYTDDVFRHLYEQVVDEETRHELGEFFTPKWKAELMVENDVDSYDDKVIDPACGSGTFLVFALRKKLDLLENTNQGVTRENVTEVVEQVWGIDVNPLSGLLARTNIYLTLTTHVAPQNIPGNVDPNVMTADTFIFPRYNESQRQLSSSDNEGLSIVPVPITDEITVPVYQDLTVDEAQDIIEQCGELLVDGVDNIPDEVELEGPKGEYQAAIFQTMKDLRRQYGDNLWKFVLKNYGVPPLLSGEFDVVLGNPPWLSFREARGDIEEIMDKIAAEYDIKPPVQGKTSFNLAIPFFLSSTNLLSNGGTISFVLPLSVLDGVAHAPFVDMLTENEEFTLQRAYDLEDISPTPFPHTLPSAILTVQVNEVNDK